MDMQSNTNAVKSRDLESETFIKHMVAPPGLIWLPHITQINIDEACRKHLLEEIQKARRKKAAKLNEIIVEAFAISAKMAADVIYEICYECSKLKYELND